MLTLHFTYNSGIEGLDEAITAAVAAKLTELTKQLYDKVMENVSGKILQKRSGQLAGSIHQTVALGESEMVGTVFPEPASPKAWALEKGGKEAYIIMPTKASILHWFRDDKDHYAHIVNHPPSKEFAYLRLALEDMQPVVGPAFTEAIQNAIDVALGGGSG